MRPSLCVPVVLGRCEDQATSLEEIEERLTRSVDVDPIRDRTKLLSFSPIRLGSASITFPRVSPISPAPRRTSKPDPVALVLHQPVTVWCGVVWCGWATLTRQLT